MLPLLTRMTLGVTFSERNDHVALVSKSHIPAMEGPVGAHPEAAVYTRCLIIAVIILMNGSRI